MADPLKDALYTLNVNVMVRGSSDYKRGILVGAVSGVMSANNWSFDRAFEYVSGLAPDAVDFDVRAIPNGWRVTSRCTCKAKCSIPGKLHLAR